MTKVKSAALRLTDLTRIQELEAIIKRCFVFYDKKGDCDRDIANKTGLSVWTIAKMRSGLFSTWIRYGTVQKLCGGCGLRIDTDPYDRMTVVVCPPKPEKTAKKKQK